MINVRRPVDFPHFLARALDRSYPARGKVSFTMDLDDSLGLWLDKLACLNTEQATNGFDLSPVKQIDPTSMQDLALPIRLSSPILECVKHFNDLRTMTINCNAASGPNTFWPAIAKFPRLRQLALRNAALTEPELINLDGLPDFELLDLALCTIDSPALDRVFDMCRNITSIRLLGTPIDVRTAHRIASTRNVTNLGLSESSLSRDTLAELAVATQLNSLTLEAGEVTDTDMRALERLEQINKLEILGCPVTGGFLAFTKLAASIRSLWLGHDEVEDTCVRQYLRLPLVEHLAITNNDITDLCADAIASHDSLRELSLNGTKFTDFGVSKLGSLVQLRGLHLARTCLSGKPIPSLGELNELVELDVTGVRISDDWLRPLRQLPHLTSMALGSTDITPKGLDVIAELPLQYLEFATVTWDERFATALTAIPGLRVLVIGAMEFTDAGIIALSHLVTLERLVLSNYSNTAPNLPVIALLREGLPTCDVVYSDSSDR